MKTETSAGGIIVKKFSRGWKVLLLKDMNNTWTFPKGLVESAEAYEETASREIAEEVGLSPVRLVTPVERIEYTYRRSGVIKKTVHYFLFEYKGRQHPVCQTSEGIQEADWFPFAQAYKRVGYAKTNLPLLKKAYTLVTTNLV